MQAEWGIGPTEEVKVVQLSANANSYRDAIKLADGRYISVQKLPEGFSANVISVESYQFTVEAGTEEAITVH